MNPKKVIALFVALAFVAIILGFVVTWYQSQFHDGEYSYSNGTVATQFENKLHTPVIAEDGFKFYIVDVTVKNDNVEGGISPAKLVWKTYIDSTNYNMNHAYTELHVNGPDFIHGNYAKGTTAKYTIVFEIPENAVVGEPVIKYNYISTDLILDLKYNPDLTAEQFSADELSADVSRFRALA